MAKQYRATNTIRHGKEGGEVVEFERGDLVTGLTAKEMAALWEAGSLEEASVASHREPERSETEKMFEVNDGSTHEGNALRGDREPSEPKQEESLNTPIVNATNTPDRSVKAANTSSTPGTPAKAPDER
jgi:hypothetical protein